MGNSVGNKATAGVLPKRTAHPGVYSRGSRYVAVYRLGGRQRKEFAATFAEARAIKLARDAEAREERRGPILHAYALAWVARHAGSGRDTVCEQTREEYRRLLATYALCYFAQDIRLADIDRRALQGFIGRSSRTWSVPPSHATVRAPYPSPTSSPESCARYDRPPRRTRTSCSSTAADGRSLRKTSEIASFSPQQSVPTCKESGCTRCATRAPRC